MAFSLHVRARGRDDHKTEQRALRAHATTAINDLRDTVRRNAPRERQFVHGHSERLWKFFVQHPAHGLSLIGHSAFRQRSE